MVIAICIFALLGMSITAYIAIRKMSEHSAGANAALGNEAADSASGALIEQANQFLMIIAQEQSRNCSALFNTMKYNVEVLEGIVMDLFNNPEYSDRGRHVIKPSEMVEGVYSSTYILPKNVSLNEAIRRELNLLSHLGPLLPAMTNNPDIVDIYVGMESGMLFIYTPLIYETIDYDPRVRPWYIDAAVNPGEAIFTEPYEDAFGKGIIMSVAKTVFNKQGTLLGVASIDINLDNFQKMVMETRILKSGYAFIINSDGKFIMHPRMGTEGFNTQADTSSGSGSAEGYRRMMNGETGFFTVEENGEPFFIAFSPVSVTGWSVGVTVNKDELLSAIGTLSTQMESLIGGAKKRIEVMSKQMLITFAVIFTAVVAMVVFLSIFLTSIISRPIQKLTEEVVKIGAGNLDAKIEGSYNDEFDKIKDAVNSMAAEIKTHMEDKLQAEKKLNERHIAIMFSQIQPHFLYNALAVISSLCDEDPAKAKKATVNFSNYLRANMNLLESTEPIPFENELNHTICFMNLEQAMYGEELNVIYDIQTKCFKLPALTMQPIVENAVKHGIGKKEGGGTVAIATKETDSGYQIIISDDGAGFDTNKTANGAYDGEEPHIGISNVRFRLSSQSGGALDIESKPGEGTTARIFIPKTDG
jgi:sensor histidine kinase YesM